MSAVTLTDRDAHVRRVAEQVSHLLVRSRRFAASAASAIHPDLQVAGYHVLVWIARNSPAQASGIAAALLMDKSAVSRQLAVLRDLALIDTRPDEHDRRASVLTLSDTAQQALERVRSDARETFWAGLNDWTDADLETFEVLLARFNA